MTTKYYDIIIIGTGLSGLYSAMNIKETSPTTSFLLLEKYKKNWIGGRTSNETFYGNEIVTGAGIGRKTKDRTLYNLVRNFNLKTWDFEIRPHFSSLIRPINIKTIIDTLKQHYNNQSLTFKEFAQPILGTELYKRFILTSGYTDYENEDVYQTLYHYGMEDNSCCWTAFHVPWKKLVMKMFYKIGEHNFKFSQNVVQITKKNNNPCLFEIETEKETKYMCNRVIIATTIDTVRKLLPQYPIYNDIESQPFLRLYGKFSKKSIPILKEYIPNLTIVPGPLQKICPINADEGIYMIAYNDNQNTLTLKNYRKNTEENRNIYNRLIELSLDMPNNSIQLLAIKDFYWPVATHYYKPLNTSLYKNRKDFIYEAQHPEEGILVIGEAVSLNQGWTHGAIESSKKAVTKSWINKTC
jgi:hypothetical protein